MNKKYIVVYGCEHRFTSNTAHIGIRCPLCEYPTCTVSTFDMDEKEAIAEFDITAMCNR